MRRMQDALLASGHNPTRLFVSPSLRPTAERFYAGSGIEIIETKPIPRREARANR